MNKDLFGKYPEEHLLEENTGYYEVIKTKGKTETCTLDSFGNLECSPPVTGYPFGRIIYGEDKKKLHHNIDENVTKHLDAQKQQSPFSLDVSWLEVGHVDEFISFIPHPQGRNRFKVVLASPVSSLRIIEKNKAVNLSLFQGIDQDSNGGNAIDLVKTLEAYKALQAGAGVEESKQMQVSSYVELGTTQQINSNITLSANFRQLQTTIQGIIDMQQDKLKKELFLEDSDFIKLPVLFHNDSLGDGASAERCEAFTSNSVNMLVDTHSATSATLIMPKPFGPMANNICLFEEEIRAVLAGSGNTIQFLDCFLSYHVFQGEIHCGTNTRRVPPKTPWWEHKPT